MKITGIRALYWSATGGTEKIVTAVASRLAERLACPMTVEKFTLPAEREKEYSFTDGDLAVVGIPTYAGRAPNVLVPFLTGKLHGNGALAVPVVTFGNRSFDNSLAELCGILEGDGFHTVAGGAFVCRHAFTDVLADGRPNGDDLALAAEFADGLAEKVQGLTAIPDPVSVPGDPAAPYYIPKGTDGQPAKFLKAKPRTDPGKCCGCGLCARICPMGAIDPANVFETPGICIKCQACVRRCTRRAKFFDDPAFLSHRAMLEETFRQPADSELFF